MYTYDVLIWLITIGIELMIVYLGENKSLTGHFNGIYLQMTINRRADDLSTSGWKVYAKKSIFFQNFAFKRSKLFKILVFGFSGEKILFSK